MARTLSVTDQTGKFKGLKSILSYVYKRQGLRGIWKGWFFSTSGIIVFRAMYYGLYDSGIEVLKELNAVSFRNKFILAQVIVWFAEWITYPTDTIRRRLMV